MFIPYLHNMINDHKATMRPENNKTQSGEWKIQLSMHVNFISLKDTTETRIIYVWSDNEKFWWVMKQMILLKNFLDLF